MTPTCSACRFWKQNEGKEHGECRRYPPQSTERVGTEAGEVSSTTYSDWPLTDADEWCGEFSVKTP